MNSPKQITIDDKPALEVPYRKVNELKGFQFFRHSVNGIMRIPAEVKIAIQFDVETTVSFIKYINIKPRRKRRVNNNRHVTWIGYHKRK